METTVLLRLRESDKEAFKAVYEKYSDKIYYVSRRFGLNHEDATEIVQDVFIKVWERRHGIRIDLSFNAYLLTITKNFIIKRARNIINQNAIKNHLIQENNSRHNDTEDLIVYTDLLRITNTFIESLPKQQRDIFKLNKVEHLSMKEISEKLEISPRTVENQLFRASRKLKEQLKSVVMNIF